MSFDINTNITSLQAQQYLRVNSDFQAKTINRVTSGLRILSSGDDAAGLAIANGFRSDQAVLTQGIRNANDGLSTLQTIDGGMNNISQLLDRARTLATQSASGTFNGDRNLLNSEFTSVLGEIDRQAQSIGLNSGGIFAKSLAVFIGGGRASGSTTIIQNGSVSVDLSKSTVDSKSLGMGGVQAIGTLATDIGSSNLVNSVALIAADATNKAAITNNTTTFYVSGPGFSGANEVAVNVSLAGVTDTATLVTNVNNAIAAAGLGGTQYATAFKNAGVNAAINTDSAGRQQLTFSSSTAAFQVEAGDRMANALLGNFVGGTGPTGKDLANTITGAATINAALVSNVIVRIQGAGLASPVDITLASGLSGQAAIDNLNSQVSTNTALQAAGITVNDPTVTGTISFTSKRGEAFGVSAEGDTKNTLGLGTFYKSAAATFDYSTITAGAAITTGGTQTDVLEFSVGGGPVQSISVTLLAADTAAQINDKINSQLAANSVLKAAGIGSTQGAGTVTLASTNNTAFRVREAGGLNANAVLGFATAVASVAIGQGAAADIADTVGDNTDNVHFNAGGVNTTAAFKFNPLVYGGDSQTVTFAARDSSGAEHTTQVVLQNAVGVGTANARSLDEAIASINTKLQSSNDSTLQRIVAVKDYIDATHEGVRFMSTLPSFNVSLGAAGTGSAAGIGLAADQGQVYGSTQSAGGSTAAIDTQLGASNAVTALSTAVSLLGTAQAVVGKGQNQFNFAVNLAQSQVTNLAAAESRIRDADLAAEAANLTKAQILLQAGTAAVAQANSSSQAVLALLR